MLNLTEEEIAALPVGKELDELIFEYVLGWIPPINKKPSKELFQWNQRIEDCSPDFSKVMVENYRTGEKITLKEWSNRFKWTKGEEYCYIIPNYSSDIKEAWKLLESFSSEDWYKEVKNCCEDEGKKWCVFLYENSDRKDWIAGHEAGEIAEAICKACLETRGKNARKIGPEKLSETQETDN